MATIHSYTTIEQSKTLSKILSHESADMYWNLLTKDKYARVNNIGHCLGRYCVYAWSLAALLYILPTIDDEFEPQLHRSLNKYICTYEGKEDSSGLWKVADNPVDACVNMIIKLHEFNLL